MGFPVGSVSKESTCNEGYLLECRRHRFDSWVGSIVTLRDVFIDFIFSLTYHISYILVLFYCFFFSVSYFFSWPLFTCFHVWQDNAEQKQSVSAPVCRMWWNARDKGRIVYPWVSQVVLVVKNLPVNTGDVREAGWILGLEDPLEEEIATHFSILAWRIPWAEESGRLQSMGLQSQTRLKGHSTQPEVKSG